MVSAIDAAAAAGIPVSCWQCESGSEFTSGKVVDTRAGGTLEGEAIGNYIVAHSGGKGNLLFFVDHAFPIDVSRDEGAKKVITELCPACKIEEQAFVTTELEKAGPPIWTAALASHPAGSLNWLVMGSGTEAYPEIKTTLQLGRLEIKITGTEAEPEMEKYIKEGKVAVATSYANVAYAAWAAADEVIRKVNHQPPWDAEKIPVGLVTSENVETFLKVAPKEYEDPKFNFREMFKTIWSGK
jgi:ABC-type sugar transport system substrate-binding protein